MAPTLTDSTEIYRAFCQNAPADFPVFMQDWYLDAVCGTKGRWAAAIVQQGDVVRAVMPYFLHTKWGFDYVSMPLLCRHMGPYLLPEYRNPHDEAALIALLIEQLPQLAAFEQDFNYAAQNWLPFFWKNYAQTTRYSYIVNCANLESAWQGIKADYRNNKIKKAQGLVEVKTGGDVDAFRVLQNLSFARQGLDEPLNAQFFTKFDAALAQHHSREIFLASDRQNGALHAGAYLIWDQHSSYLLMSGADPALRQSGANMLLIWECIRYTHETLGLKNFDFSGSMLPQLEPIRRHFGARQQAYLRVWKHQHWLWKLKSRLFA